MFRKAEMKDVDAIAQIYDKIHTAEEQGLITIGWNRSIYPTRESAKEAILKGVMFVEEDDGKVVAAAKIDKEQVPVYAEADWEFPADDEEVMVLHTLVVDTEKNGKGYGTKFVDFYEKYALENNCPFLRMDTNERNAGARSLYKKLGYKEISIVSCVFNGIDGVNLVCLEKKLGK